LGYWSGIGLDIDEGAAVDGIEPCNLQDVSPPHVQPDNGREHGVGAGRAAGREDFFLRDIGPAHRMHAVEGPAFLRHPMPPVQSRDMGILLGAVKQPHTALIDDDLQDSLLHAADVSSARVGPFPHRDAILTGDEEGLLHGVADEPHGPQDHAAGIR